MTETTETSGTEPAMRDTKVRPIQLRFDARDPVVVTPEGEDRFTLTVQDAVRACRAFNDQVIWRAQFLESTRAVHEWCEKHQERVGACCVGIRDSGLAVFIVTRSPGFDFEFDRDVGHLEVDLVTRHERCPAEVLQLPLSSGDEISGYVNLSKALQVDGDGIRAARESGPKSGLR